jgi:hypothetical protein
MSSHRLRSVNSRKLATLFLTVVLPPAVTLVWLGLRLLRQDRSLLAQRELESRQAASQTIVRSLEQLLAEADRRMVEGPLPDGEVRFTISKTGLRVDPATSLLWLPAPVRLPEVASAPFAEAEVFEFQGNLQRTLPRYDELARSPDAAVGAGALLRLARVYRQERKWDSALGMYRRLALMSNTAIDGVPSDLVARTAICSVFEEVGRTRELEVEAEALETDFLGGRWALDRPAWELTAGKLEKWIGRSLSVAAERKQASAVADWLWKNWKRSNGDAAQSPRRVIVIEGTPYTLLSQGSVVLAILPSTTREWLGRVLQGTSIDAAQVRLVADSGETVAGPTSPIVPGALRFFSVETSLPWTLVLTPGDSGFEAQAFVQRRRRGSCSAG